MLHCAVYLVQSINLIMMMMVCIVVVVVVVALLSGFEGRTAGPVCLTTQRIKIVRHVNASLYRYTEQIMYGNVKRVSEDREGDKRKDMLLLSLSRGGHLDHNNSSSSIMMKRESICSSHSRVQCCWFQILFFRTFSFYTRSSSASGSTEYVHHVLS